MCIVYPLKKKHVMITANFVSKLRPEIDTFSNNSENHPTYWDFDFLGVRSPASDKY